MASELGGALGSMTSRLAGHAGRYQVGAEIVSMSVLSLYHSTRAGPEKLECAVKLPLSRKTVSLILIGARGRGPGRRRIFLRLLVRERTVRRRIESFDTSSAIRPTSTACPRTDPGRHPRRKPRRPRAASGRGAFGLSEGPGTHRTKVCSLKRPHATCWTDYNLFVGTIYCG